ncbi:cell adhesion molecule Dscam2-like [Bacillus rossius redtenbacheri]|uniref:cell adhesion molecule Dscam2-like n=1 Tax=Bacillus rossius redtenbacheri TaxID=93214 RepID=UPI002FDD1A69
MYRAPLSRERARPDGDQKSDTPTEQSPPIASAGSLPPQAQGPVFVQEPPAALDFSNSTGGLLSCQAQGSPAPEIRWLDASYKELRHLSRLREVLANGSLFFPPFAADDFNPQVHASTYYCRAANPAGSIVSLESRVRAVVWQPYQPQVDNVFVMRGNVAVLTCGVPVFAREFVAVTGWQRDERPRGRTTLHPGGRYSMTSSGSLHVHDTVSSDTFDQFYCWVADRLTGERRLSLPGQIVVTDPEGEIPPRIEHSIPNVHVKAGETADLVCIAKGNPPPSYRWYREVSGVLQEVQPSSVLVWPVQSVLQFPRAQPEDAARYVCSAGSALGEDRREVALGVSAPLSARVRPHQQVVDVGAAASFRCHVSGGGARVSWLRNGRPVAQGERTSLLQGAQMLVIHSVRKEDRGMYQCVARAEEESAQASAQLALGAVAPEMLSSFVEQTLQPGPPVTLRCVASGSPPPQFSWALDGAPLPPQGYLAGSFVHAAGDVVSHLNISSVRVQHGGLYTCLARNILGAAHHSAPLNIYGPPTARPPQNITAAAGADAYLRCPVAGYPISSVAWRRAREVLPAHPRQRVFPNGTLGVRQADGAADRGEYRCTATSPQGEVAQGRIHLNIMSYPEISSSGDEGA